MRSLWLGGVVLAISLACGSGTPEPPACVPSAEIPWDGQDQDCDGADLRDWRQVVAGRSFSCGLKSSGEIACWGAAPEGAPTGRFTRLAGSVTDITAHLCAVAEGGDVTCWGDPTGGATTVPAGTYRDVGVGLSSTCGLHTDGHVSCWGDTEGTAPDGMFVALAVGAYHACALDPAGKPVCWGADPQSPPSTALTTLDAGMGWTCGVDGAGGTACWGSLPATSGTSPVRPPSTSKWTAVSTSGYRTCAIADKGYVSCWEARAPVLADAPSGSFTAVSVGDAHACAIRTDGSVACWGNDDKGQASPP